MHQHNNPRDAQGKGAVSGATPGALGTEAAPEAEEWSSDSEALGEFSRPAPRPAPAGGYAPALAPSAGGAAGVCASYRAAQPPARGHRDLWAASHGGGVGAALEGGMKLQYSTGSGRGNGREGGGGASGCRLGRADSPGRARAIRRRRRVAQIACASHRRRPAP